MISLIITFFLLSATANANTKKAPIPTIEIWSLGNEYFPMEKEKKTKRLISENCRTNKCEAFKAINDHSKKSLTEDELRGGKNPGSVICKKYFKGTVLILQDKKQNENAFCKFSDGSLVSASAL